MASHDSPPTDPFEQVLSTLTHVALSFFIAWRRALSSGYRRVRAGALWITRRVAGWAGQWGHVTRYLTRPAPERVHGDADASRAAAFGARAFAFGLLASGSITIATGGTSRAAVATLVVELAWAAGRFAICAALVPVTTLPRSHLALAYLTGLAPYALGLTAPLRIAALAASALLTARELRAAGPDARTVRTAVGWAFGGQALVVVFGFVLRGGLAVLTGS
ncbi:MAG: hypothetical protein Q7W44_00980 [Coriobacteriia bacterium]|nr:hypothetical protein [Coriobacteriia bacterium]